MAAAQHHRKQLGLSGTRWVMDGGSVAEGCSRVVALTFKVI